MFLSRKCKTTVLLGLGMMGLLVDLAAQQNNANILPKSNSPYSRFGLGDLAPAGFVAQMAMGGTGIAMRDGSNSNWINPASFSSLENTVFELGIDGRFSNMQDERRKDQVWSGNISYLSLAFSLNNPINRAQERKISKFDWGMGIHLRPYTTVGYDIENVEVRGENLEQVTTRLKGTGGLYKLGISNGLRYKNLSLGAELQPTFGKVINSRAIVLDSIRFSYSTDLQDNINYSGVRMRYGTQYVIQFDKANEKGFHKIGDRSLILGAYYVPKSGLNTTTTRSYTRLGVTSTRPDTILYESDIERGGQHPSEFGVGIMYEVLLKLRITADYTATRWSEYENEAKPENMLNSRRYAFGFEFIPNIQSYSSNWAVSRFRAGVFHATDPRSNRGTQLTNYGINLGVGIPIIVARQAPSYLNIGLEAGRFGVAEGLRENYIQMNFALSLNDNSWFYKRKFN